MEGTEGMIAKRFILTLWAVSTFTNVNLAQEVDSSSKDPATNRVQINSNIQGALVFIDGLLRGSTPFAIDSLAPGTYILKAIHPDISNWLSNAVRETVVVSSEPQGVFLELPQLVMINSDPSEAEVLVGDSILGQTPYLLDFRSGVSLDEIALLKEGYRKEFLDPTRISRGSYFASMEREWDAGIGDIQSGSLAPNGKHPRTTELYLAGAAAILSGVASAYYKTRADRRFDDYLLSGDQRLLSEINRFDTRAGVALAITQIGTFLFVYFLLSE